MNNWLIVGYIYLFTVVVTMWYMFKTAHRYQYTHDIGIVFQIIGISIIPGVNLWFLYDTFKSEHYK